MDTADRSLITYLHTAPRATQKALAYMNTQQWLKRSRWYLAGGTALALQVGHRQSVDLDFFTPQKDFSSGKLIDYFSKKLWHTDIVREGTVYGELLGAKVSFIAYPFFVPGKPYVWHGCIRMLDPYDIAVMKIIAISQRGRKRDFVDMYWLCKHQESLSDILHRLSEQYPTVAHDYHHIIKSLTYFTDAENDPMPKCFFKVSWPEIKRFFAREATHAARTLLKLR